MFDKVKLLSLVMLVFTGFGLLASGTNHTSSSSPDQATKGRTNYDARRLEHFYERESYIDFHASLHLTDAKV